MMLNPYADSKDLRQKLGISGEGAGRSKSPRQQYLLQERRFHMAVEVQNRFEQDKAKYGKATLDGIYESVAEDYGETPKSVRAAWKEFEELL